MRDPGSDIYQVISQCGGINLTMMNSLGACLKNVTHKILYNGLFF